MASGQFDDADTEPVDAHPVVLAFPTLSSAVSTAVVDLTAPHEPLDFSDDSDSSSSGVDEVRRPSCALTDRTAGRA